MAYRSPITLVGNIAHEPTVTDINGSTKLNFSMAVEHRYMKDGEWVKTPSFFNVVAWRQTADQAAKLLEKGLGVMVIGRLEQRSYEDKEGVKKSVIDIVADEIAVNVWGMDSLKRRTSNAASAAPKKTSAPSEDPW